MDLAHFGLLVLEPFLQSEEFTAGFSGGSYHWAVGHRDSMRILRLDILGGRCLENSINVLFICLYIIIYLNTSESETL